ncbi:hypothetical protein LshimejAT787_0105570 [Lyophyllum shimeji]|uniref:Uncharacterized protein n=1 Tax=Lyophyllum shimeji TaxID=47721 RepID=A0A9P3PD80_LYOSH|nr:hypothetical protein LshimejAT787_0105570 [Lyophyllum shimeji]
MRELEAHKKKFNPAQLAELEQRVALHKAFVDRKSRSLSRGRFAAGTLTVIDLSDPFVDPTSVCEISKSSSDSSSAQMLVLEKFWSLTKHINIYPPIEGHRA